MYAEVLDGAVFLAPPPGFGHQDAVLGTAAALRSACPGGLRVVVGPFVVRLGPDTELRPDVLVARYADLTTDELAAPPLLAVEVRSPGTALLDRSLKKAAYARFGVPSFWIVDPDVPALTAYRLGAAGGYAQVAHAVGTDRFDATEPFRVSLVPVALVAGLEPG